MIPRFHRLGWSKLAKRQRHDGTFGPKNFEMSPSPDRPLNDAERDRMDAVLSRFRIDGFFAALICSPEIAKPSQYLPEIWGGEDGGWRLNWMSPVCISQTFNLELLPTVVSPGAIWTFGLRSRLPYWGDGNIKHDKGSCFPRERMSGRPPPCQTNRMPGKEKAVGTPIAVKRARRRLLYAHHSDPHQLRWHPFPDTSLNCRASFAAQPYRPWQQKRIGPPGTEITVWPPVVVLDFRGAQANRWIKRDKSRLLALPTNR
jgi:hypothetical protein